MPAHNLPVQQTSFEGRREEVAEIAARLADPSCRLLTLVGPGGIGKTRLALHAAADQLVNFADGVYFVPLSALTSADLIAPAIAGSLEIHVYGAEDPRLQLIQALRQKHLLLVLDNFEHLLEGTALLAEILAHASGVKILVTSRERLNIVEEWALTLTGLSYPDGDAGQTLETYSAIQLFARRARSVDHRFSLDENAEAVKAVCRWVQGMPLAIEIAAGWLRVMSCQQIAAQIPLDFDALTTPLRNLPERHRSMRTVFEYSWTLLSPLQQSILMRLSCFQGGFDLEAAQAVAGASLTHLAELADKSLIHRDPSGRYGLHELLRQFAAIKLQEAGENRSARDRHLSYFQNLVRQAEANQWGRLQVLWYDRLEAEFDNLRAALDWTLQSGQPEAGLSLAASLGWFFSERCFWSEGLNWLERALAAAPDAPPSLRAKALHSAAGLAGHLSDLERGSSLAAQSLDLAREIGDRWNIAWAQAHLALFPTDLASHEALLEDSLAIFRELNDIMGLAHTLVRRTFFAEEKHDHAYAETLVEEAALLSHQAGDRIISAWVLLIKGRSVQYRDRDLKQAARYFEESVRLFREARFHSALSDAIMYLAQAELILQHTSRAVQLYLEALSLHAQNWSTSLFLSQDLLAGLAGAALASGDLDRAATLLGAAHGLFATVDSSPEAVYESPSPYMLSLFQTRDAVRVQLGESVFAAAWAVGTAMIHEQAIAFALEGLSASDKTDPFDLPPKPSGSDLEPANHPASGNLLKAREREVLLMVAEGLSNREISDRLVLALPTVKWYINEIFSKLHVNSRTQAVAKARQLGLI